MHGNRSLKLVSIIMLIMFAASACTQTYSQAPLATPTLISTGLFVSPFPSGQDPLKIVADLGTQTAMAKTAQAGGTTTPGTAAATSTGTLYTATTAAAVITGTPGTTVATTP